MHSDRTELVDLGIHDAHSDIIDQQSDYQGQPRILGWTPVAALSSGGGRFQV
jgi:hypothetical protein